jgi:periplasmic protein TonB
MRHGIIVSLLLHALAIMPLLFVYVPKLDTTPGIEAATQTRFVAHTVNIEALQPKRPPTLQAEAVPPPEASQPIISKAEQAVAVAPVQPETVKPARTAPPPGQVALQESEPFPEQDALPEVETPPKAELPPEPEPPPEQQALEEPEPLPELEVATEVEPLPEPEQILKPEPPVQEKPAVAEAQPPAEKRMAMTHEPAAPGAASPAQEATETVGAGTGEPDPDYLMQIRALIEQHKRYPPLALRFGMEGEVRLWFVLNREGEVLDYRIAKGSGHAMLDEEVQRMIEEITFPPLPPDYGNRLKTPIYTIVFHITG